MDKRGAASRGELLKGNGHDVLWWIENELIVEPTETLIIFFSVFLLSLRQPSRFTWAQSLTAVLSRCTESL